MSKLKYWITLHWISIYYSEANAAQTFFPSMECASVGIILFFRSKQNIFIAPGHLTARVFNNGLHFSDLLQPVLLELTEIIVPRPVQINFMERIVVSDVIVGLMKSITLFMAVLVLKLVSKIHMSPIDDQAMEPYALWNYLQKIEKLIVLNVFQASFNSLFYEKYLVWPSFQIFWCIWDNDFTISFDCLVFPVTKNLGKQFTCFNHET